RWGWGEWRGCAGARCVEHAWSAPATDFSSSPVEQGSASPTVGRRRQMARNSDMLVGRGLMLRITLERFAELLEAYGADPERWPDTERAAARYLLDGSADARSLWEQAAAVDRLLDGVPEEVPSAALVERVLAAVPRRRVVRAWRRALIAAVPLAAAATVTLWLTPREAPAPPAGPGVAVATMGEYTSPTDVLLEPYGIDVYASVPSIGCADSELGCPKANAGEKPYSLRSR